MKNKKKLFSVLSIVLLIILVLGATYAYFASQSGGSASVDITLTADTVDTLVFTTGNAITLNATQENFASGDASLSSSTTASATLTANETTNSASGLYYVYLQINSNDFVYTKDDDTAELILTITDPNGDAVETLSNLTYTTVTDNTGVSYSGFDITTWGGLIPIAESYAITATDESVTQDWTVTVTFVNLVSDQSDNAGASIDIDLIIQDSEITLTTLADYIISQYSEDGVNNLYYFDGSRSYINADLEADDLSYRYSGSSDEVNNYVCFGSYASTCDTDNLYRIIGIFENEDSGNYEVKLIKYDYATNDLLGTDGDCIGNIYTDYLQDVDHYLGTLEPATLILYYWSYKNIDDSFNSSGYYNDWSYSELNKTNLNTNYLTNIRSEWSNLIVNHTWIVGGNTTDNIRSVASNNIYINEITNPVTSQVSNTYDAKVGLVYISDYTYATDSIYWNEKTYNYNTGIYEYNWLFMGLYEWTITRDSSNNYQVFNIGTTGRTPNNSAFDGGGAVVRPTFYLSSSTQLFNGDGSYSNPYRLNLID